MGRTTEFIQFNLIVRKMRKPALEGYPTNSD